MPAVVRIPRRAPRWIVPSVKVGLVIADALAAAFSFMLAFYVRERVSVFAPDGGLAWSDRFAPYGALLLFVVGIRLLSFLVLRSLSRSRRVFTCRRWHSHLQSNGDWIAFDRGRRVSVSRWF